MRNIDLAHIHNRDLVEAAFSREALKRVCELPESDFAEAYEMTTTSIHESLALKSWRRRQPGVDDFYYFRDNGSDVLAVAHLDTVMAPWERTANFVDTEAGPVIFSGALDDRLGAYIILELLPALGINYDVLLTVGEESGQSTAEFFQARKDYNWMIEFDRGGTDVVMYQYEDTETKRLVEASGARVGDGIFSDISYMEHLGIKGFNWGVGYQDYHGPRSHAFLADTFSMVAYYLKFHEANAGVFLPHEEDPWLSAYDDERECDAEFGKDHDHDDEECSRVLREMSGTLPDPMYDIPAGTPDSWIPDNPNEDGFRQADFV